MSWFSSLLAGFQVATYGRFWVATDGQAASRDSGGLLGHVEAIPVEHRAMGPSLPDHL
jgi:hypothetical protein